MKTKQSFLKASFKTFVVFVTLLLISSAYAQANASLDDEELLSQFIKSKGYQGTIIFNASNIKQFWIDKSISSQKNKISVLLDHKGEGFQSAPLKIQLTNVNEAMNCKIEVISEETGHSFFITNASGKKLAESSGEDDFLQYHIASATIGLEDANDFIFNVHFSSKAAKDISFNDLVLSFSKNPNSSFCASPGKLLIGRKNITVSNAVLEENKGILVSGKRSMIVGQNNIIVPDNEVRLSANVKNTGSQTTRIHFGFIAYSKDGKKLDGKNYPFKNNTKSIQVISAKAGSDIVLVDSYPQWDKNCYLALNVKDDFSDIPNISFANGKIVSVTKLDNGQAEIKLDKKLDKEIAKGTKVRINGQSGSYLYLKSEYLQPGEEKMFDSPIQKNGSCLQYSAEAFSKGMYYVKPLVLSYSKDSTQDNTVLITDFSVSY